MKRENEVMSPRSRRLRTRSIFPVATLLVVLGISCDDTRRGPDSHEPDTSDADADGDSDTGTDTETELIDTDFPSTAIPATCEEAAENPTSVGCVFFAVDMDNYTSDTESENPDSMPFAVVVSNPQEDVDATISLWDGIEGELYTAVLEPGELEVIEAACDPGCLVAPRQVEIQGLSKGAGFRLTSDVPVLAYQWNPYGINSFVTDASLLFPVSSLGEDYIVAAWGTGISPDHPDWPYMVSQVTVVATEDDTQVVFTPSVDIREMGGVGPYAAGVESPAVTLDSFDVLTLAPTTVGDDVTGTRVSADKPVAVFGGHSCAKIPSFDYGACDHLEEQLLPLSAWGASSVLARHAERHNCVNPDLVLWRVIAGADDMVVSFDPPAPEPAGPEHHFESQGDVLEFLAPGDYFAEGALEFPEDPAQPEAPFLAYQLMTCASMPFCVFDYLNSREGDPDMLQSPPAGQYLDRYVFNTDEGFDYDFDHIIVVRPSGAYVAVDCLGLIPDSEFTEVGSSGFEAARIYIDDAFAPTGCTDGAHLLTASAPVGLSVVGTARNNSYSYLGGVGVKPINPTIE
ncbi:MAG: IgGFc-binding protein [Proteobacteria bacterium]|jgi:hypothetical protein|nr:IgGFc-binding protein [Pseudomonadota bacterium]